jgi:hypothetical protein
MCKYRAYFCKSEKRVQKGEDGRKKTKELALQSFWSELEENARVSSWKDGEGSLEPVEAAGTNELECDCHTSIARITY